MGVHRKIQFLGWVHKKPIYRKGGLLKNGGAWSVCRFKSGLGKKEGNGAFSFFFFFFFEGGGGGGGGWALIPNAHFVLACQ